MKNGMTSSIPDPQDAIVERIMSMPIGEAVAFVGFLASVIRARGKAGLTTHTQALPLQFDQPTAPRARRGRQTRRPLPFEGGQAPVAVPAAPVAGPTAVPAAPISAATEATATPPARRGRPKKDRPAVGATPAGVGAVVPAAHVLVMPPAMAMPPATAATAATTLPNQGVDPSYRE